MAFEITEIDQKQVNKLLGLKEGQYLDFKALEISPGKLTKHLSAFANADGGELFLGCDEPAIDGPFIWRGFQNPEDANGHIQAFEALFPLGQDCDYEFISSPGKPGHILHVTIRKTKDIRTASDGKPYLRRNAGSFPVEGEALKRLELNKGLVTFENERVSAPTEALTQSEVIQKFLEQVVPHAEPANWLRKQQLIEGDTPTVAGCLLFADEPQIFLPKRSGVKVYRYKTTANEGSRETMAFRPITIDGCLYAQIELAVAQVVEVIEQVSVLSQGSFGKAVYPQETLHEIITNALLHRDYSIPDDVHIRIFDNRVEVESPGVLPGHITPANILNERFARNPILVRLINKFPNPPNMDVGEGLNTAFAAMKNLRLKEPQIIERTASVLVNIRHEPLGSPEEIIIGYLTVNGSINNSKAREICHIGSENKVKRIFQRLMKENLIETIPGLVGKLTAYRKKEN